MIVVHSTQRPLGIGDTAADIATMARSPGFQIWALGHLVAIPALAYHGYKRNNSVGWALVWGLLGSIVWPVTGAVAIAQGYGKRAGK